MKVEDDPFADLEKLRLHPEHNRVSTGGAGGMGNGAAEDSEAAAALRKSPLDLG